MGRPKKKIITVTEESLKQSKRQMPSRRGRPRKTPVEPPPVEDPPMPEPGPEEGEVEGDGGDALSTQVVPISLEPQLGLSQGSAVIISPADMPMYSGAGEGATSTQEIVVMHPVVMSGDDKSHLCGQTFTNTVEGYGLAQPGQQIRILEPVGSLTGGQQAIQYHEVEHQNMAFIPTAPGQATLVVAGPTEVIGGGAAEVITQDGHSNHRSRRWPPSDRDWPADHSQWSVPHGGWRWPDEPTGECNRRGQYRGVCGPGG